MESWTRSSCVMGGLALACFTSARGTSTDDESGCCATGCTTGAGAGAPAKLTLAIALALAAADPDAAVVIALASGLTSRSPDSLADTLLLGSKPRPEEELE